jgi:hypothetical protein
MRHAGACNFCADWCITSVISTCSKSNALTLPPPAYAHTPSSIRGGICKSAIRWFRRIAATSIFAGVRGVHVLRCARVLQLPDGHSGKHVPTAASTHRFAVTHPATQAQEPESSSTMHTLVWLVTCPPRRYREEQHLQAGSARGSLRLQCARGMRHWPRLTGCTGSCYRAVFAPGCMLRNRTAPLRKSTRIAGLCCTSAHCLFRCSRSGVLTVVPA